MKLQITQSRLVETEYGFDIQISGVGLFNDDGIIIKRIKLNKRTIKLLERSREVSMPDVLPYLTETDVDRIQKLEYKKLAKNAGSYNLFDNIGNQWEKEK